jgi:hypothetical protein
MVVCQNCWLPGRLPLLILILASGDLLPLVVFSASPAWLIFLKWYARTAGLLLGRISFQLETVRELLYMASAFYIFAHVPFLFHKNQGTESTTHRALYG